MRTRVKEFRAKYNLTHEELAKKSGVKRELPCLVMNKPKDIIQAVP
ncbi:MAG: hypothetical protein ACT6FF_02945 [Methanosarcinaceae archaeon]